MGEQTVKGCSDLRREKGRRSQLAGAAARAEQDRCLRQEKPRWREAEGMRDPEWLR